jgi:hypothetical protein
MLLYIDYIYYQDEEYFYNIKSALKIYRMIIKKNLSKDLAVLPCLTSIKRIKAGCNTFTSRAQCSAGTISVIGV